MESLESFLLKPLPETIPELADEIERINTLENEARQKIRALMDRENPAEGAFFAVEIHELKQYVNMLETHREFRNVRIRRWGLEPVE